MRFAAGMSRRRFAAPALALTVAQMHAHVVRVCKVNGIEINYTREARADGRFREVWIRPVRSPAPMRLLCTALRVIFRGLDG